MYCLIDAKLHDVANQTTPTLINYMNDVTDVNVSMM